MLTKTDALHIKVSGERIGNHLISRWPNLPYKIDGSDVRDVEAWFKE